MQADISVEQETEDDWQVWLKELHRWRKVCTLVEQRDGTIPADELRGLMEPFLGWWGQRSEVQAMAFGTWAAGNPRIQVGIFMPEGNMAISNENNR